ncbi:MAG: winged helix-turn-helix transcriptional regulator [Saprospiraceae bacterium]|nr:winged helix-turn-helix transcriptional regulator [Saprospiraceae bacterium]
MNYNRKPANDSGYLLWQISNLWQRVINEILSLHEITHVQYLLLATIVWMKKNKLIITQNSLAKQAQSHKMMTSKVLRSLEKNGYVMRITRKDDSRYKIIELTDKGHNKYLDVKKVFEKEDAKFFEKIERNRFSLNRIFIDMIAENSKYAKAQSA